jgi:hypothetical protein
MTYYGHDMYIFVWDCLFDDNRPGMGWKVLEGEVFKLLEQQRIYTDGEVFKRYEKDLDPSSKDLVNETRSAITQWFLSDPARKTVYCNGIRTRRSRAAGR